MNVYLLLTKDGQIYVKFHEPPKEVIQLGVRVFVCSPGLSIGYLEYWAERGFKTDDITEINL